jgi:hypothetical protein
LYFCLYVFEGIFANCAVVGFRDMNREIWIYWQQCSCTSLTRACNKKFMIARKVWCCQSLEWYVHETRVVVGDQGPEPRLQLHCSH